MADLDLDAIEQKILDILKADAATQHINWQRGRFSPNDIRKWPAGGISPTPGADAGIHNISTPVEVASDEFIAIKIWTSRHEGVGAAETEVSDLYGKVRNALFAKPKLDLERVGFFRIALQSMESNAEATPPYAEAVLVLRARIVI